MKLFHAITTIDFGVGVDIARDENGFFGKVHYLIYISGDQARSMA